MAAVRFDISTAVNIKMNDNDSVSPENQFNWVNISKEIRTTKEIIEKGFKEKITILSKIADYQTRLLGIYFRQSQIKVFFGMKYDENMVLQNTLGNVPYQTFSILLLVRNTFFGSARVLMRQFFEALIYAKYSEYDSKLIKIWNLIKSEEDPKGRISLGNDVFNELKKKGKRITALEKMWRELCRFSHPTAFSQQELRVPHTNGKKPEKEVLKWNISAGLFMNVEYTLDLLFVMLNMSFHLLTSHLGRKSSRFYFGYPEDPQGFSKRERKLKMNIKVLLKEYWIINKRTKIPDDQFRKIIFQYRQKWE